MKHIWILNHYAQEPNSAGGSRHYHLADQLASYGWDAVVIAASVELNTGRQRLKPGESRRLEQIDGVQFLWVRTPKYEGNGSARLLNMLAYSWRTLLKRTTRGLPPPDVVLGSSVHPFAALAGLLLARRFGVPFIFEVRDLWPQTLIDMGRLKEGSPLTWVLRKMELWLYRHAARVVVLLPQAWEYIVPLGIPKERIVWTPNGVDLSLFPRIPDRLSHPGAPFTLMYFGAHGQANGLDNVLRAMKLLQDGHFGQAVRLRLIGDGPLKPALMHLAEALQLRNVCFEQPVAKNRIPTLAAEADAFVFNLIYAPVFRYGISANKLFDYMASGRPILFSCDAANNPVHDAGAGLTVEPGKPEALAEAIEKIASMPKDELQRMGRGGREYVERNHDFKNLSGRLAGVLDDVVQERRRAL
jgi:glycosyltransferase involved in cell wall biosynthesis